LTATLKVGSDAPAEIQGFAHIEDRPLCVPKEVYAGALREF
jgi:hypothetical protein